MAFRISCPFSFRKRFVASSGKYRMRKEKFFHYKKISYRSHREKVLIGWMNSSVQHPLENCNNSLKSDFHYLIKFFSQALHLLKILLLLKIFATLNLGFLTLRSRRRLSTLRYCLSFFMKVDIFPLMSAVTPSVQINLIKYIKN
jgi:hypothetical protein